MELNISRLCMNCMTFSVDGRKCTNCGTVAAKVKNEKYALQVGTILNGKYLIGKALGEGGFGITYIAYDLEEHKRAAIKEFFPGTFVQRARDGRSVITGQKEKYQYSLNRFYDEANTIHRFGNHPNIIHVYKLFKENNTAYFAMEYLDGMDLEHVLMQYRMRMPLDILMQIILPVMDALDYVHAENVIHRDISPDNIYVGKTVKLIDFGAARVAIAGHEKSLSVVLKHGFAPEEQYRSHGKQGPWTDIYALAATMYFCLTGTLVPDALDRLSNDSLKDIRTILPNLNAQAADAIMKGLAVRAADRYASIAEFRSALTGQHVPGTKSPSRTAAFKMYGLRGDYAGSSLTVEGQLVAGRDPSRCHLVFSNDARGVSNVHCCLWMDPKYQLVMLKDLNSTYGTRVNGRKMERGEQIAMNSGDCFEFGVDQVFEVVY